VELEFGDIEGKLVLEFGEELGLLLVGAFQEMLWLFWGLLAGWA